MPTPSIASLLTNASARTAFLATPLPADAAYKTTLHLLWLAVDNQPDYADIQNLLKEDPQAQSLLSPLKTLTKAINIKQWSLTQQEKVLFAYNSWTTEKRAWFVFLLAGLENNSKLYQAAVQRLHQQEKQDLTELKYARLHYERLLQVFLYEFSTFTDCVIKQHQCYLYTQALWEFYKQRAGVCKDFDALGDLALSSLITELAPEIAQTIFTHMASPPSAEATQKALVESSKAPNPWPHIVLDMRKYWLKSELKTARTILNASFTANQPFYRHLLLAITHCGELPNKENTQRLKNCVKKAKNQYDKGSSISLRKLNNGMFWAAGGWGTLVFAWLGLGLAFALCTTIPVLLPLFIAGGALVIGSLLAGVSYWMIKGHMLHNRTSAPLTDLNDTPKAIKPHATVPMWKEFAAKPAEAPAVQVNPSPSRPSV